MITLALSIYMVYAAKDGPDIVFTQHIIIVLVAGDTLFPSTITYKIEYWSKHENTNILMKLLEATR